MWSAMLVVVVVVVSGVNSCFRRPDPPSPAHYRNRIIMDEWCKEENRTIKQIGEVTTIWSSRKKFYPLNMNCTVILQTEVNRSISLKIRYLNIPSNTGMIPRCATDFLKISSLGQNGTYKKLTPVPGICGEDNTLIQRWYQSSSGKMSVNFVSGSQCDDQSGFELIATSYTLNESRGCDGFLCGDGKCISDSLQCDKIENCEDGTDENNCRPHSTTFKPTTKYPDSSNSWDSFLNNVILILEITAIVVIPVALTLVITCCCCGPICCNKKRNQRVSPPHKPSGFTHDQCADKPPPYSLFM